MKRKLSLQTRIVSLAAFLVVAFLCLFGWMFARYADAIYSEKRLATRHIVEVATTTVEHYAQRARVDAADGGLSKEEAQRQALEALKALRYGEGDYVWVNDMGPRMLMHPTNPKLDGQDLSGFEDPTGKRLFVEFVDVCRREGAGFVDYLWPKPGFTEPQPKISYVARHAEWDWVVGSGIYVDDVRAQLWSATLTFALALAIVLVLAGVIGWQVVRRTVGPVAHAVSTLDSGISQVRSAAVQVSTAAQELSEGATRQAASIEEISASMEEMASLTRTNADHAREVATFVAEVGTHVGTANRLLGEMGASMTAIEQSSGKVTGIVKAIDEIAFQTNILALNAAVEAARAGEAGMGFAVVADEVRALAQRAAAAARDATSLVEDSVTNARQGAGRVGAFGQAMAQVTEGIDRVRGVATEVSEASEQQRQGIAQVSQAIAEMEQVTQRTAATAEESAAASEELQAQTEASREAVAEIVEVVGAQATQSVRASDVVAWQPTAGPAPLRAASRRREAA